MKVLQVATVASTLRAFILPFADHFRGMGWVVDGMANGASDCGECVGRFDTVWEARWTRSPLNLRGGLGSIRDVRHVLSIVDYDLVHVHTPIAAFVARFALRSHRRSTGLAVVYTAHGFHFHENGGRLSRFAFRNLEKLAGRWTDALVVLTEEDYAAALRLSIVPRDRLHLIEGIGVDTKYYSPSSVSEADCERVRDEIGVPAGVPIILTVGDFIPRKRHADALRAFAQLESDAHLMLAGDGALLDATRKLAATLEVSDRVHFLGHRHDMPTLMGVSDLTLVASQQEGLSRCVLESMSMGVPIVGTDIRGVRELIGNDECGVLVRVGDTVAMASAIDRLLGNPAETSTMGQSARERAMDYDICLVLDAYGSLYTAASAGDRESDH